MSADALVLDVRDDIRRGREPFSKIMQAVASLGPAQDLVLIAPFEPAPLYKVLKLHGLNHSTETTPDGDFKVRFSREMTEEASGGAQAPGKECDSARTTHPQCAGTPILDVDARGLEPPQPMVKILEAVASLPEGAQLRAHTDRRPMHLYAQLEARGFSGASQEEPDGSFVTVIKRRANG